MSKKYVLMIFVAIPIVLFGTERFLAKRHFNEDVSISSLPGALRTGRFSQKGNLQWTPVYGASPLFSWAMKNSWQECYVRGESLERSFTKVELNMIKTINVDVNKIETIYNKTVDGTDIAYLICCDPSVGYVAMIIVFRT